MAGRRSGEGRPATQLSACTPAPGRLLRPSGRCVRRSIPSTCRGRSAGSLCSAAARAARACGGPRAAARTTSMASCSSASSSADRCCHDTQPLLGHERAVGDGGPHRAAGLGLVGAVAEAAAARPAPRRRRRPGRDRTACRRRSTTATRRAGRACRSAGRRRAAAPARTPRSCGGRAGRLRGPRAVRWRSRPTRVFTSVDLPTPDAPMMATVRWPVVYAASSSRPIRSRALTACTGTARATARTSARAEAVSSITSALVRITTGSAPDSNTSTSSRSSRRWFGGAVRAWHQEDVSMLAAATCTWARAPSNEARRIEGALAGEDPLDVLVDVVEQHPVAHGHLALGAGPQAVARHRLGDRPGHGAPAAVEARGPAHRRAAQLAPTPRPAGRGARAPPARRAP